MIPFPEIEKIAEPQAPAVEQVAAWWWWAGVAVLGLILLFVIAGILRAFFRRASLPGAPPRPEKVALREIKSLRRRAAVLSGADFGSELSGIVRSFLHRRMGMLAHFATTEEILGKSRRRDQVPPPPLAAAFTGVLEGCDALKFGSSPADTRERLLAAAESAIHAVADALKHPAAVTKPSPGTPALPDAPSA